MQINETSGYPMHAQIVLVNDIMQARFGELVRFIDCRTAQKSMGFFSLDYLYLPQNYRINFEAERGHFTIRTYREEGSFSIVDYPQNDFSLSELTEKNITSAIDTLLGQIQTSRLAFYVSTKKGLKKAP